MGYFVSYLHNSLRFSHPLLLHPRHCLREPHSPNTGLGGGWRQAQQAAIKRGELGWPRMNPNSTPPWPQELRQDTLPLCSLFLYKNESNNSVQLMEL